MSKPDLGAGNVTFERCGSTFFLDPEPRAISERDRTRTFPMILGRRVDAGRGIHSAPGRTSPSS